MRSVVGITISTARWWAVCCLLGIASSPRASAQPTVLDDCLGQASFCRDVIGGELLDAGCPGMAGFRVFDGHVAWPPLTYTSPITIAVKAKRTSTTVFPLYIEIVSLKEAGGTDLLCIFPGRVVMVVQGADRCDAWERVGPIDLAPWIQKGEQFAVRALFLTGMSAPMSSPVFGCIRVAPDSTTAVPDVPSEKLKRTDR